MRYIKLIIFTASILFYGFCENKTIGGIVLWAGILIGTLINSLLYAGQEEVDEEGKEIDGQVERMQPLQDGDKQ